MEKKHDPNPKGGAGSHKVLEVEDGEQGSKRRSSHSWGLLCWRLQEAKEKKRRSKMKKERRRGVFIGVGL